VAAGLARILLRFGGDRIVRESESNYTGISPVDMSEWVAYSSRSRVMKKLHSHDVGPVLVSVISLHFLILTKEAAHA
jgi:hypothetical protein